jgi:hypothetical protein
MFPTLQCHQISPGRCDRCGRPVLFARRLALPDHRFHALVSLLTGGLWLLGWLACWCNSAEAMWECQECGTRGRRPVSSR